jgi:hypothetical protein
VFFKFRLLEIWEACSPAAPPLGCAPLYSIVSRTSCTFSCNLYATVFRTSCTFSCNLYATVFRTSYTFSCTNLLITMTAIPSILVTSCSSLLQNTTLRQTFVVPNAISSNRATTAEHVVFRLRNRVTLHFCHTHFESLVTFNPTVTELHPYIHASLHATSRMTRVSL